MVSPSGILHGRCHGPAAEVQTEGGHLETCLLKKGGEKMMPRRLPVDGCNQHSSAVILAPLHLLLREGRKKTAQIARHVGALRFFRRQKYLQCRVVTA